MMGRIARLARSALRTQEATLRNRLVRHVGGRRLVETALPWRAYGDEGAHVFFGYHDITPFHARASRLLAHRVPLGASPLRDAAEVGVFERETGRFTALGRTDLWCWQMGARLRWLPNGQIAWNALADERTCGCAIADADSGRIVENLRVPLYDIDPYGRYGLSLDFSRLHRLRPGYGYARLPEATPTEACPSASGIELVSLADGRHELLLSVAEIAAIDPHPGMAGATHYLNHLTFAPNGERFCVFHIWQGSDERRRLRHLVFDLDGRLIARIPGQEHVSHYDWLGDGTGLLVFARLPGDPAPRYQVVDIATGERTPVGDGTLAEDGHPMYRPGHEPTFVSDTYPDRNAYRRLYLCDSATGATRGLATFHSPTALQGETRCDLHPRWSRDGRFIAVDSAHTGRRAIIVIDLGEAA